MVTLERLSSQLGIELHMKRDDLTGSHLSGNKIRKLDFLLADAMELDATHVITCGGLQSNHARATALAAVQLGLSPVLLLRTANGRESDLPNPPTANVLLDRLSGARIETCTPVDYRERRNQLMDELAHDLKMHGGRPYVIPEGGSHALLLRPSLLPPTLTRFKFFAARFWQAQCCQDHYAIRHGGKTTNSKAQRDFLAKQADQQRKECRQRPTDVVTEPLPRTTNARRKEFGQKRPHTAEDT